MAVGFGSFGRSPFGAFIKSPLGARDSGAEPGDWYMTNNVSGPDYWSSLDGITWNTFTAGASLYEASQLNFMTWPASKRLLGQSKYTDSPFGTLNDMMLGASTFASVGMTLGALTYCVRSGSKLIANHPSTGTMVYSSDGGANWTAVTLTAPSDNGPNTFGAFTCLPMVTATGRVIICSRWVGAAAPTNRFFAHYSDDGGVTWTATASLGQTHTGTSRTAILYQKASGRIWHVPVRGATADDRRKKRYSDDNGATWNLGVDVAVGFATTNASKDINGTRTTARSSTTSLVYSDDDFVSFTTVSSLGFPLCIGTDIYYVDGSSQIQKSTNGGQTFGLVATTPSSFTNYRFLTKLGITW